MSFNIEWTNADALTPSPVTVIKDGCHFESKLDAHYVSDEEIETLRRYIVTLNAENAKLRELVRTFYHCTTSGECDECPINGGGPVHLMPDTICDTIHDRLRELGVDA